ncbi:MAG TPA: LCP family protein [Solirubrobacterales bacterium]|nr:LCP family protein [Solirubrobacterales bacterium]
MIDDDDNDPHPSDPTEEFLLGALDEGAEPLPERPARKAQEPDGGSDASDDPPEAEGEAQGGDTGESAEHGESTEPAEPGEYVEQPTEEQFALEARILSGEDVPDLDPVFRAALLESPESVTAPDHSGQTGEYTAEHDLATDGEGGESPTDGEGDEPPSGEYAEGTQEWDLPSESEITAEQTAILAAAAKSEVHDAIETSRRTGRPWDPRRPPVSGDFEDPAKRPRYWWRFLLATVIIVFSFAGATSASIINVVNDITGQIGGGDQGIKIPENVLPKDNGGPQTIAILGSDVRTGGGTLEGDAGRSDTTMLMRLDPDSGQIAMLSIPRDLKVDIPGYGVDKFNAAFTYGGPQLTLKTIKSVTGLDINHVINVDFQGFAEVVDAIGCVFVDVDRDYYNSNEGVAASEQYAEIDIDAGYQKLCGPDALEFARYRHTDSDLARAARQQDLVGEVRNRLSFGEIIKRRSELIKAFTNNTRSDISGSDESLQILKLLVDSKDANVVEISFPSTFTMENGISYVEATPEEIQTAVDKFLGFEDASGPVGTLDEGATAENEGKQKKKSKAKKRAEKKADPTSATAPSKENDGLVDASIGGQDVARDLDSKIKRDFPIFYAKRLPEGTIYAEGTRNYHLRDPDKNPYAAYRQVMSLTLDDGTHYFGIQGLRGWNDPPILDAPHEGITMDGRDFNVYWEGDRIRLISWTADDNTYWISNSILLTLENEQMLGMARSTKAFTPG